MDGMNIFRALSHIDDSLVAAVRYNRRKIIIMNHLPSLMYGVITAAAFVIIGVAFYLLVHTNARNPLSPEESIETIEHTISEEEHPDAAEDSISSEEEDMSSSMDSETEMGMYIPPLNRDFSYIECGYAGETGFVVTSQDDINALCDLIESIRVIPDTSDETGQAVVAGGYPFQLGTIECTMLSNKLIIGRRYQFVDSDGYWKIRNALEALESQYRQ